MSISVKQFDSAPFENGTIDYWLKALGWRNTDFVANSQAGLVYQSGDVTITMHGYVAADYGTQPRGWELNNSQITRIDFAEGNRSFEIKGFAMDLRETFNAQSLDSFRDWTEISSYGDYRINGTGKCDVIAGADEGSNSIAGRNGDDELYSTGIRDRISGGQGDDLIHIRNDGHGRIWGGSGSDTFVFDSYGYHNSIRDFRSGQDVLDLRDFLETFAEDNHLDGSHVTFTGDGKFSGHGLEIGFEQKLAGASGDRMITTVEISADGVVSELINLHGYVDLAKADFLF